MKKLFFAAIVFATGTATVNAQAVATATATATIVAPISIAKTADMNFGNMAVSAAAGDVVTLAPTAAATRTASGGGGVSFPAVTGTVTAARFTVTGQANYTFDVALPSGAILENGANSMFADNFTASAGAGTLDATGTQVVYVGADLLVAAAQAPGVYVTSTPFVVAVNYN
jgi:hypothetical protein